MLSRDLIDLAMMAPPKKSLRLAIDKAEGAYGDCIETELSCRASELAWAGRVAVVVSDVMSPPPGRP